MTWQRIEATKARPGYNVFTKEITKSPNDDRGYRLIQLENGLQAILVHDATADNAAAALNVGVGQLMDPEDIPGLAHFCEHMSFLGTEQYPIEGSYGSYITANGGWYNAYTDMDNTCYYFSITTSVMSEALERFSTMFHSPLFTASATKREMLAVDSEHKKNDQNDYCRIFQVWKSLSRSGHAWGRFGNGNLESLTEAAKKTVASLGDANQKEGSGGAKEDQDDGGAIGRETRRRLMEWWNQQYCAGRMKLSIIGKDSLDQLTDLTVKLFSPIKNRGVEPFPLFLPHPHGPDELGTTIFIKSLTDIPYIRLTFPIPYQGPHYESKPAHFLCHILGHGGPGSVSAYFLSKGWILDGNVTVTDLARGTTVLDLRASLTTEGLENYREIIATVFQFVRLIRGSTLPAFLHEDHRRIRDMAFRFLEKSHPTTYTAELAHQLQSPDFPREHLLKLDYLTGQLDEKRVREILDLCTLENSRILLVSKNLDKILPEGAWRKEKWYGTEYKVVKHDQDLIRMASTPRDIPELAIPKANEFIPINFQVNKQDDIKPLKEPVVLRTSQLSSLWYKKDDQFWVPSGSISLFIKNPIANISPVHGNMTHLLVDLVTRDLMKDTYDASLAQLSYDLYKEADSLVVRFQGFNEKLPILLGRVLERIKNFRVEPGAFEVMKANLKRKWENHRMDEPNSLGQFYCHYLLVNDRWLRDEYLAALELVTVEGMQQHIQAVFSRAHIQALVHGNFDRNAALAMMDLVEAILKPSHLTPTEQILPRSFILPEGCNFVWNQSLSNDKEQNSCLSYYCHVGLAPDRKAAVTLALLAQIIQAPLFNQLRTTEQLGYAVFSDARLWTASLGLFISIQTERDPSYAEERLDIFLASTERQLREIPEEEFQKTKTSLIETLEEKLQSLDVERSLFWSEIKSGRRDFQRNQLEADCVRETTKEDVISLFMKKIHPSSPERSKISVHLRASQKSFEQNEQTPNTLCPIPITYITDVMEFKSRLCLSEAMAPPMHKV